MLLQNKMSQQNANQLVEHFFRHEYGNLVAVLSRLFGFTRIDLVEDMVGSAMVKAMHVWQKRGVPNNPASWIHQVAKNQILDSLRKEKAHEKAVAFSGILSQQKNKGHSADELLDRWLEKDEISDSLLRMMFVCCHPSLDRASQIALTLKILCGFSVAEIARGLITPAETIRKRIQRSKKKLAEIQTNFEFPEKRELGERLEVVHEVLYLMFNEGYSTSHGIEPIRDEVCEEAARLCHLLCENELLSTPRSRALLSLMLFHASRLESRVDDIGNIVLLEYQDRSKWNRDLISAAEKWLVKSAHPEPSRFHLEAVIAKMHCSATSIEKTDWETIVLFYERLISHFPSPIYRLNRAIALAQWGKLDQALDEISALRQSKTLKDYYLLDCAAGHVNQLAGNVNEATDAYLAALAGPIAEHQKTLIEQKLKKLNS